MKKRDLRELELLASLKKGWSSAELGPDLRDVEPLLSVLVALEGRIRYRLGTVLAHIRDHKLYEQEGHLSMRPFLRTIRGKKERTLREYMALADAVPAEVAAAFHPEQIELGLELLGPGDGEIDVINLRRFQNLRVAVERDGERLEVPFAEASVEELEAAVDARRPAAKRDEQLVELSTRVAGLLGEGASAVADVKPSTRGGVPGLSLFVPKDRIDDLLGIIATKRLRSRRG